MSSVSFSGLGSIDQVTDTSVRLNWTHVVGAASYAVYDVSSGSAVFVTAVSAPIATYTVSGLTSGTTYRYRVRLIDSDGLSDANTNDVSTTTLSVTGTHTGWSGIKAVGARTPAAQATGLSSAAASVTLNWNAMTLNFGSVDSYNIYRSTTSGGQNYSSPLNGSPIAVGTRSYTDSTVTGGTTYYYTIAPVVSGVVATVSASADREVKVIVPPANMALLHRWAANQEMCTLMGKAVDRDNNYRCDYTGPGNVSNKYDVQVSKFVDAYETGCNYTPAPACGDATNGCLGTAAPNNAIGSDGNVFYDREGVTCYVKVAGSWTSGNTSGISAANRALLASNKPGLPPLVKIDQNRSYETCQAFTVPGFAGAKKLLSHQEQVLAGAWPSSLSDATIASIENGTSINTTGNCNTNSGSGLTYDNNATPADLETLPGTNSSGTRSVRTGGTSTQNCVSRYGIQDLVGNVWEWSSNQLGACNAGTQSCQGIASGLDATNTDWTNFHFDGSIGPGGGGLDVTEWDFSAQSFSSTQILLPFGLPVVGGAASSLDATPIGAGAGQFDTAKFHGDHFWLHTEYGGASRGADAGGGYGNGARSGRFTLHLDDAPSDTYDDLGFRCALPAE